MPEMTKCDKCGAEVTLLPCNAAKQFPNLWFHLDGPCLKCGHMNRRRLYKCRACERNTVHKFERMNKEKQTGIFSCEVCGTEKSIYWGLRRSPERSMMATGR